MLSPFPEDIEKAIMPKNLSDNFESFPAMEESEKVSKEREIGKGSFADKELYSEQVIAAYKRLMDITFWDPAAASQEDDEPESEEDTLKTVMVESEPTEGMAAAYKQYEDVVKQLVCYSETHGFFTLIDNKWYAIASGDNSLEGLVLIDIDRPNYKTVRELYTKAKTNNQIVRYEDIEKYAIEYVVNGETPTVIKTSERCPSDGLGKVARKGYTIELNDETEKMRCSDLPPALRDLMEDMITRVENKIGHEEALVATEELQNFISGRNQCSEREISHELAKLLRLLT